MCQVLLLLRSPLGASVMGGGGVAALLTPPPVKADFDDVQPVWPGACRDVSAAVRDGESRKRVGLTKKTPVLRNPHAGHLVQPIPPCWKRLHVHGFFLGMVLPRGGVKHRFWENVMGLAELFGVWVHCPMPPASCMDEFSACRAVG